MWWSDRRGVLAAAGLLALGGCGFTPLYGEAAPGRRLRSQIEVGEIRRGDLPDRMAFELRAALRRHFAAEGGTPRYRLDVAVEVTEVGLAVAPDNATTRYNLTGRARWTLVPLAGDAPALTGETASFTAYSATATVYATRIAQRDAERRLATDLAGRIATGVAARAGQLPA
jgi:LPS-assembly lipoprotein